MNMYQIFREFNGMHQRVGSYELEENAKAALEKEDGLFMKVVPIETREEFLAYLTRKGYVITGNKATHIDENGDYLATYLILHYERGSDSNGSYENGYCLKMLKHADIDGTIIEVATVDDNGNFCDLDGIIYESNLDNM